MQTITWTSQSTRHPRYGKGLTKNIAALLAFFKKDGWVNLGNFGVRPIRGGTNPSAHSFGVAQDLGYGTKTRAQVLHLIDWIIANAEVLGIQELHDYAGLRVWIYKRPAKDTNMGVQGGGGWRSQKLGSHGGGMNPGSRWIHIESAPDMADNATPIEERLARTPRTNEQIAAAQLKSYEHAFGGSDFIVTEGYTGDSVVFIQAVLADTSGNGASQDLSGDTLGTFGKASTAAVKRVQQMIHANDPTIRTDGLVDFKTWQVLGFIHHGWTL